MQNLWFGGHPRKIIMSTGSLKLSINLSRGVSSTVESNKITSGEKEGRKSDCPISGSSHGSCQSRAEFLDERSVSARNTAAKMPDLLNVNIPTAAKAQKRKHIQTNFDNLLLNESALDAQRKEKARLERLERQKQTLSKSGHLQQTPAMLPKSVSPLPVLDAFDPEVICLIGDNSDEVVDSKKNLSSLNERCSSLPSMSKVEPEVIELSSGDEDEKDDRNENSHDTVCRYASTVHSGFDHGRSGKRPRLVCSERERLDQEKMERQHQIEKQRMRKRKNFHDLERIELTTNGRLLVNAGHGPEDPDVHICPHLTHILQPHQLGGVRFMYDNIVESLSEFKKSPGFGCILAHSMGLGKTIQVIAFVEIFLRVTQANKVLIIVPVNTIQNWMNEFEKWMPSYQEPGGYGRQFEVFLLGDSVKTFDERVNVIEDWSRKGGVLLVGYEMFRLLIKSTQPKKSSKLRPTLIRSKPLEKDEKLVDFDQGLTSYGRIKKEANDIIRGALVDPGPDMVVCDEGHRIKNLNTDVAAALSAIQTKRRIVLTGYPLQNNLMEYYCMVDFVRPDFLGSKKTFSVQFERPIKNGQCIDSTARDVKIARQRIHVLSSMLKGFIQRRTHHLLKAVLPEAKEFVLLLRKSPLQHVLYRNFVMYANAEINSGNNSVFNPLKAFAACSKIWNHPDVLAKTLERRREERKKSNKKDIDSEWSPPLYENNDFHLSAELDSTMFPRNESNSCVSIPGPSFRSSATPTIDSKMKMPVQKALSAEKAAEATRITHMDLWSGLLDDDPPVSLEGSNSLELKNEEDSNQLFLKNRRISRIKPKSIQKVLEDEFDLTETDQELQYDWAETAMASYRRGNIEHGYKMVLALELLDATVRIGEKMLIFSQNLTALDLIESYLSHRQLKTRTGTSSWMKNINYFRLDGSTPGSERERLINRFNADQNVHLFLISTKAGSLGINLVSANRCIIFDACWNPCLDAQAVCRVYRYGQQKRTYIYRLILNNSMEKAIFNRQISKQGLQQRVVDDAQVDANITQKELETLLMYDESLDVIASKWDTSSWNFDDEVLESVVKSRSEMLAEEPFLHESLMLEREEGLSEEEKKEAELWFAREQFKDESSLSVSEGYFGGQSKLPRDYPRWLQTPYFNSMTDIPPLRSTPIPHKIDRIPEPSLEYGAIGRLGSSFGLASWDTLSRNRKNRTDDEPPRVPPFPGAAIAFEPFSNNRGSVQCITTDRSLSLPIVSHPSECREIPANTQAMLVRSADGVFLRLGNGLLLNAQNSIFDPCNKTPPPLIMIPPDPPQPLRLPAPLKTIPDVIELD